MRRYCRESMAERRNVGNLVQYRLCVENENHFWTEKELFKSYNFTVSRALELTVAYIQSLPCLLGQHGSCSTTKRPVELLRNHLTKTFGKSCKIIFELFFQVRKIYFVFRIGCKVCPPVKPLMSAKRMETFS